MRALLQAVQHRWAGADKQQLVFLTARLRAEPLRGVGALHDAQPGAPVLHFEAPDRGAHAASYAAGRGVAAHLEACGPDALARVRAAAAELFSGMVKESAEDCEDAPPPRLYGGLRFAPQSQSGAGSQEDPWRGFPDASFVLPRWLLAQEGQRFFLQLAVRAAELREPAAIQKELSAIEDALCCVDARVDVEAPPAVVSLDESPPKEFCTLIEAALSGIKKGEFVKVVAARQSVLTAERPFLPAAILRRLAAAYPECCRFAVERDGAVFLGATPELLIMRRGRAIFTEALAGTRPRFADGDEAAARAALLADDKERREHVHVISAITEALHGFCAGPPDVDATAVRSLRNVHHLCTPIHGALRDDTHVLDLVTALHPTPAVCGLPRRSAARFLAAHEPISRGMYAAPVGFFDARGDGAFFVAIRSALLRRNHAWLFAGAGIVAGSDPQREYRETAAKQRAMLGALSGLG